MDSTLAIAVLTIGFIVLVWTFVWVARLMAMRSESTAKSYRTRVQTKEEGGGRRVKGRGYGANYGFLLGFVGCTLFFLWPSPMLLALAVVGFFHSMRAVFRGVHYFHVVIWRGLIGALLNCALPVMLYLYATGQWDPPILDVGLGLV